MKRHSFIRFLFALSLLFAASAISVAQPWYASKAAQEAAATDIASAQKDFNTYWADKTPTKGSGWKQFKRWEWFVAQRAFPSGKLPDAPLRWQEFLKLEARKHHSDVSLRNNVWEALGPSRLSNLGSNSAGLGRVNAIAFDPRDESIIWLGAASGGVWRSSDAGNSWSSTTDDLPSLAISDIAFTPSNPDIMYIGTGDPILGSMNSAGILKSTDAGTSWQPTGLSYANNPSAMVTAVVVSHDDPNYVLAGTAVGLQRSTDGGATWSNQSAVSGGVNKLLVVPGAPDIMYAMARSNLVYRSGDAGRSWQNVSAGLPGQMAKGTIAVTAANPDYIYALFANFGGSFGGLYRSTDGGASWTAMPNSQDVLDNLGYYALALAVSPIDPNDLIVGSMNLYRSQDGGNSWYSAGHWGGWGGPYIHADHHVLLFSSDGGTIFSGNDGGIARNASGSGWWEELSNGLAITQYYRMGGSASDPGVVFGGAQDNGTTRLDQGSWDHVMGADGMECAVDPNDPRTVYATMQSGILHVSRTWGSGFSDVSGGRRGNWVTPFVTDPREPGVIYIGYDRVFRVSQWGGLWDDISGPLSGGFFGGISVVAVAPSDPQTLYAASGAQLYRTTNQADWNVISSSLPQLAISSVAVHNDDPATLWATFSGYQAGQKVYQSTDGGASWTNISFDLPNVPFNSIVHQPDSDNILYAGGDLGVFYLQTGEDTWQPYNEGIPNVIVSELEIHKDAAKLRAATYGRGIWQVDLVNANALTARFASVGDDICAGETMSFADESLGKPESYLWTFEGGIPASSTDANPQVVYPESGSFDVELIISSDCCSDTLVMTDFVEVNSNPAAPVITQEGQRLVSSQNFGRWQWQLNGQDIPGATSRNYEPTVPGSYTVRYTSPRGCSSLSEPFVFSTVQVASPPGMDALSVFPNPGSRRVRITGEVGQQSNIQLRLFNILGIAVHSQSVQPQQARLNLTLDVSHLAEGMYYLEVEAGAMRWQNPLIIRR